MRKTIKLLLLLVMAIVSQGAWANHNVKISPQAGSDESSMRILGELKLDETTNINFYGGDCGTMDPKDPPSYNFYTFYSPRTFTPSIKIEASNVCMAIFDEEQNYVKVYHPTTFHEINNFEFKAGKTYFLGFKSHVWEIYTQNPFNTNVTISSPNFCNSHRLTDLITVDGLAACDPHQGARKYFYCNVCKKGWTNLNSAMESNRSKDLVSFDESGNPINNDYACSLHHFSYYGKCEDCYYSATALVEGSSNSLPTNLDTYYRPTDSSLNGPVYYFDVKEHGIATFNFDNLQSNDYDFTVYDKDGNEINVAYQDYGQNYRFFTTGKYYMVFKPHTGAANTLAGNTFSFAMHNHGMVHVDTKDATCEENGCKDYWTCAYEGVDHCESIFKDEACTEEIFWEDLVIPSGHIMNEGICDRCGLDINITEGEHIMDIPATNRSMSGHTIDCYEYLRRFIPTKSGKLHFTVSEDKYIYKSIAIFNKDEYGNWQSKTHDNMDSFMYYDVIEGMEYFIGIRAYYSNTELKGAHVKLKVLCQEHQLVDIAEVESTCTQHGHGAYKYCIVCDSYFDNYSVDKETTMYDWGLADHQLVDGVCQVCHYEVPTLILTKDENAGNYTYSSNDMEFDLKGVYGGENHSMFRVFIPEHGKLSAKAYVYTKDWEFEAIKIISACNVEYHDYHTSDSGIMSASLRRKAPEINHSIELTTNVPGGDYVYIFVENDEVVDSKLDITLTPHSDNIHMIEGKPATCTEDGIKNLFYCDHEDCTFANGRETTYYHFTEDGIPNPSDEELVIPALGHQDDGNGICSICDQKISIENGTNSVKFLSGRERLMALKYTATETKTLTIAVKTEATIIGHGFLKWADYKYTGEEAKPLSAPRRERGRGDEDTSDSREPIVNTYVYNHDVVSGEEYAIIFITSADEEKDATITLHYDGDNYYPEFEGTLELAYTNDDHTVLENDFEDAVYKFFPNNNVSLKFTALGGVTYMRNTTTSRWGTVILPYELKSNDEVTYYQLASTEGTNDEGNAIMTFTPVESVSANTPVVYRFNNEADEYQFDASISEATKVELPEDLGPISCETSVKDWNMLGFYVKESISQESYPSNYAEILSSIRYISKDKFMTATKSLTINPYRAVFIYTGSEPSNAKTFVIAIADGGTTSIQAVATANGVEEVIGIYDINGRQLNTMQRGVNIIRTADGKTHKIINK